MYFAILEPDSSYAQKMIEKCKSILKDESHQFKTYTCIQTFGKDGDDISKYDTLIVYLNQNYKETLLWLTHVKKEYPRMGIIFYSDDVTLIPYAYDVEHLYFILKKQWYNTLPKALNKAVQFHESFIRKNLAIIFKSKIDVIPISQVMYIQRMHRKLSIVSIKKNYETYMTVPEIIRNLDDNTFIQIHYSYLVNPNYIRSFKNNIVTLKNGLEISVTRNFLKNCRPYLKSHF